MTHHYTKLSAAEISQLVRGKEVSAREVAQEHLNRIAEVDSEINAFTQLTPEMAYEAADLIDARVAAGEKLGPLAGAPIGLKDNMQLIGTKMTCSSALLRDYQSVFDCTAARKTINAGMIPMGKLNLDEFAFGSSTETSVFGPTKNPWDTERVPGGSSGGSAAAVAAHMVAASLGSDTGGSIRQPGAFTGTVALKPTYGLVSRYGCAAFASSLDQIGPITKTVEDSALLLQTIAGKDPKDATSVEHSEDYQAALQADPAKLRVGIASELMELSELDSEIRSRVVEAAEHLAQLGAHVDSVKLPHSEFALAAYSVIAPAEASSNFARLDGMRYGARSSEARDVHDLYMKSRAAGFGEEVQRRNIFGTYMLSLGQVETYHLQSQRIRTMIIEDYRKIFAEYDLILTPTSLTTAFKFGEKAKTPVEMYLSDIYTVPVNLAGNAALSLPAGLSSAGMPIGIQIIGDRFAESKVFTAAATLEKHFGRLSRD